MGYKFRGNLSRKIKRDASFDFGFINVAVDVNIVDNDDDLRLSP